MYDKAEEQFRKALEIDPQNAAVLNYLGYMLADHDQKLPEALKMIREAVLLEPQNYAYLDSLGWVYYKTGQYELAEENIRKANERNNGDPTIHDHLGEVYEKTGKLKMALAQWERAMSEYATRCPPMPTPRTCKRSSASSRTRASSWPKLKLKGDQVANWARSLAQGYGRQTFNCESRCNYCAGPAYMCCIANPDDELMARIFRARASLAHGLSARPRAYRAGTRISPPSG